MTGTMRAALCVGFTLELASASAASALDKQASYREMLLLAQQIQAVKATGSAGVVPLQARYAELSQALGGDDPGRMLRRVARAKPAVSRQASVNVAGGPPAVPPGCMTAQRFYANTTPVPIADLGVASSTIDVSGLRGEILDVDVYTSISHTFPSDLDITLRSPNGRVVTLTTDNGGTSRGVFEGTLWDDGADDPAVEHVYADLTLADLLAPEEPLGALRFGQPDGLWTLTISDDASNDVGTLNSWVLIIRTIPPRFLGPGVGASSFVPVSIPDEGAVTSTLTFPPSVYQPAYLDVLTLTTDIRHAAARDLDVWLEAPSGRSVTLTRHQGGVNENVFAGTLWYDAADPVGQVPYTSNSRLVSDHVYANLVTATDLTPEEPLAAFRGEDPAGTWTLHVADDYPSFTGALDSWGLSYYSLIKCLGRGDFNVDASEDLVLRNVNSNQHVLWFMSGATRISGAIVSPTPRPGLQAVGSDHFVGGLSADLVLRDEASGQVEFWEMNGATLVGKPFLLSGAAPLPTTWLLAGTGDFNHDGSSDLLFRNTVTQDLVVWKLGEGAASTTRKTGELVPSPSRAVNANWAVVAALDFDHDNNRDLLWYNATSGNIVVWFMDATLTRIAGLFTIPTNAGDANWRVVAAGDYGPPVFGDQRNDIVWRNETSGKFVVWHMDGGNPPRRLAGTFTIPDSPANPLDWTIVGPR